MKKPTQRTAKIVASLHGRWAITEGAWQALAQRARAAASQACDDSMDGAGSPADDPLLTRVGSTAVIRVIGVLVKYASWYDDWLGLIATDRIKSALFAVANDDAVDRIVIVFDTPGGNVNGTPELAELIAIVNAEKPIHAAITDTCCSGGMWLASQCGTISANATADIGSIGVYSVLVDDSAFWAENGTKFTLVSTGGVKGKGADGRVDEELVAEVQRGVNDTLDAFINAVATGRAMPREAIATLATGQVWRAEQAKALGLIDAVESIDDAVARITKEVPVTPDQIRAFVKSNPKAARQMLADATSDAAPATPANLAAKTGDGTATLTWDAVDGASGYRLRRDGDEVYSGPDATFADTGLTNGTEYAYTVASLADDEEESAESDPVKVKPGAEGDTVPSARGGIGRHATAGELKKAFAGDDAFILARIDQPASMVEHKAAHADHLKRKVASLEALNSDLKSKLAKFDPASAGTSALHTETDAQSGGPRDEPAANVLVANMEQQAAAVRRSR